MGVVILPDKPSYLQGVRCWRCGMKHILYEVEELEDGTKLGFYSCTDCRTEWWSNEDMMPYMVRLRSIIRELGGAPVAKGEIPANMTVKRPQ